MGAGGVAAGLVRQRLRQHGQHRLGARRVARPGGTGCPRSSRRGPRGAGRRRWPRSPARTCRPGAGPGRGRRAARPAAVAPAVSARAAALRSSRAAARRAVTVGSAGGWSSAYVASLAHSRRSSRTRATTGSGFASRSVTRRSSPSSRSSAAARRSISASSSSSCWSQPCPVPPLQVVAEPLHLRVPGGAQRGEHDPGLAGVARTRVDQPGGRLGRLAVRTGPDREALVHHAGGEVHVGPVDRGAGRGQRTGPVALLLAGLGDQRPDPGAQRRVVEQRLHERQRARRVVLGTQHPARLGDPGPPDEVLPRLGSPGGRQRDGRPGRAAAYGGLRSALDAHQTSTCCRGSP